MMGSGWKRRLVMNSRTNDGVAFTSYALPSIFLFAKDEAWLSFRRYNYVSNGWDVKGVLLKKDEISNPFVFEDSYGLRDPFTIIGYSEDSFIMAWESISRKISRPFQISYIQCNLRDLEVSCRNKMDETDVNKMVDKRTRNRISSRKKRFSFMGNNLYFGNLHWHTSISGCQRISNGKPMEGYRYMKEIWGLDFAAISDHEYDPIRWQNTIKRCNLFNIPGVFTTILGYEYAWSKGHYNIYYPGAKGPMFNPLTPDTNSPGKIAEEIRRQNAMMVPHHTGELRFVIDWEETVPDITPLMEICQIRGAYEYPGCPSSIGILNTPDAKAYAQGALEKGLMFGFIGSSDHSGCQIAGVYAKELTRKAIFKALSARHCYASTGPKIILAFSLNGHIMGDEIDVKAETIPVRKLFVEVIGTKELKSVTVVRNSDDIYQAEIKGDRCKFEFEDREDTPNIIIRNPITGKEIIYYYIRVVQKDKNCVWSSPIWIGKSGSEARGES